MTLLFGIAALLVILWFLKLFSTADVQKFAGMIRSPAFKKKAGGAGVLVLASVLQARGQIIVGLALDFLGLYLLGMVPGLPAGWGARTQKSGGQVSRVSTAFLEMEMDLDSGAMRGIIIAGSRAGTRLESLDVPALVAFLADIDEDSRALLATYLDRRDPAWREHAQSDAATGQRSAPRGPMTDQEAYQVLGLQPGAKAEEIVNAHRALMKRLHPDLGGTNYLAARINEAKDTLLRQHR
jgi:DnaJ-like protein